MADAESITGAATGVGAFTASRARVTMRGPDGVIPDTEASTDPAVQAVTLRASGLTVPEVADRLGVSERSVYRWTNQETRPSHHSQGLVQEVRA